MPRSFDARVTPRRVAGKRARRAAGAVTATALFLGGTAGVAAAAPAEGFSIDVERPVRGQAVTFTAADPCAFPVTCRWSGDDGVSGDGPRIEHAYADVGSFGVTLTVDDPGDEVGESSTTRTVTVVNRPPSGTIGVAPESPLIGQSVTLTASASDPDGDAISLEWSLDADGAFDDGTSAIISRTFMTAGPQVVRLRIADGAATEVVSSTIVVGNAAPTGSIHAASVEPLTGEGVSFTAEGSDPDGGEVSYDWDVDGDGVFGDASGAAVGPFVYDVPGTVTVAVRIVDDEGGRVERSIELGIRNRPPLATFDWSPAVVRRGVLTTFHSRAMDPEGFEFRVQSWDLDDDGAFDDAFGPTVTHTFTRANGQRIGLRVVDQHGAAAETRTVIVPGNQPPQAAFTTTPDRPAVGTVLRLASTSMDPDGDVVAEQWDLDGDGDFDDASGRTADKRIEVAAAFSVALKVIDDEGTSDVAIRRIDVSSPDPEPLPDSQPVTSPQPAPVSQPVGISPPVGGSPPAATPPATRARTPVRVLKPFPSVRMAGRVTRRGAVFTLVRVTAPSRTKVSFSCRGGGCPRPSRATVSKTHRINQLRGTYRAGAVIEIRVTRSGWVGKYTRMRVNRGKAPTRRDLCLYSSAAKPRACPS